jgi:alpha-L-fucosidase
MKRKGIEEKVDFLSMSDNQFPTETIQKPWETSGTMNFSWGYHALDFHWEPTEDLLTKLVGNASRNGNFQLNVGPRPDGTFPVASVRRLREMGAWLYVNGESIYNTMPNPLSNKNWGYITWREPDGNLSRMYLHVTDWPEDLRLTIPEIKYLPEKVFILESGEKLTCTPHNGVTIKLPAQPVDNKITVIVFDIKTKWLKASIAD